MRAAFVKSRYKIDLAELPDPVPGPGEALLTIEACGLCGSDWLNAEVWARERQRFGHEIAARVAALGEGVVGFAPGDQVAVALSVPCGECEACQAASPRRCRRMITAEQGGFGEKLVVSSKLLTKIDPPLPPALAAMVEPLCVVLDGFHLAQAGAHPEGPDLLLAVGGGFLAQLALLAGKALGVPVAGALSRSLPAPLARVLDATGGTHYPWVMKRRDTAGAPGPLIQRCNESVARWLVFHTAPGRIIPRYLYQMPFNTVALHAGLAAKARDNEARLDTQIMIFRRLQLLHPFPVPMLHVAQAVELLQAHGDLFGTIQIQELPLTDLPALLRSRKKPPAKVLVRP